MERRLSVVFFLLAILVALPKCYGQGVEVACPSSTSVMNPNGATVNNSTGGSKQWLCVSNVNGNVSTTSAFSSAGGVTINPTNNVIPVRTNATTFGDSPLSVSGGNVTNTGTLFTPDRSGCGAPVIASNTSTNSGYEMNSTATEICSNGNPINFWDSAGLHMLAPILFSGVLFSNTAPTIAAAGCGGAAATIPTSNGTGAFKINVGTTPGSACTVTMPAATTGWNVHCDDITTQSASVFVQKQTGAESTTSVTITNFNTSAAATAFVASDILKCTAGAD